jgi:hypothetical protein
VLVGPTSRIDAFLWWLQFVDQPIDLVIVSDACNSDTVTNCTDFTESIKERITNEHNSINVQIVRALSSDSGYKILSCKVRTGMKKIYELYPDRKYYLKVDTDTILFPRRLFSFLNTLHSIAADPEKQPLYFGAVVESGMGLLLCGRDWANIGEFPFLFIFSVFFLVPKMKRYVLYNI